MRRGRALVVTGPNGVGKTSLLRVLCGLTEPESGSIEYDGMHWRSDANRFRSCLTFLGHRNALSADLTALENLVWGARLKRSIDAASARARLVDLGLGAVADRLARVLSAGQRRRVALTRVLLSETPLWILDEPFANLDGAGREWCSERMRDHIAGGGLLVVSSHQDPRLAPGSYDELRLPAA